MKKSIRLLLTLSVCVSPLGCTSWRDFLTRDHKAASTQVAAHKDKEGKRQPTPDLCVKFGDLRMGEATKAPNLTNDAREQLYDDARKLYQQAIDINPSYMPAYKGLAKLYVTTNDYDRAFATYEKALKKDPRNAGLWFDVGVAHARKKAWQPAIECLQQSYELDGQNKSCGRTLSMCLACTGRHEESLQLLTKLEGGQAMAHYRLGMLYERLDQGDKARQELKLALQINPKLPEAAELLVALETGSGNGVRQVSFTADDDSTPPAIPQKKK